MSSVEPNFWIWFRALEDDSQCLRSVAAAKCGMRSRQVSGSDGTRPQISGGTIRAHLGLAGQESPSHTVIPTLLRSQLSSRFGSESFPPPPHDPAHHRTDFAHEAGTLLPLQRLQIKDVTTEVSPGSPDQRQVLAIFQENGKTCAFPIGAVKGNDFRVYSDEMLFIQDPHELYKHWPADMWQSIDKHEVKPGMNELQVDFAIGMGMPERSGEASVKTVKYPNGGKPLTVTYRDGKAVEVKPGSSA